MSGGGQPGGVAVRVIEANAIAQPADVLVVKHAGRLYGLDALLVEHLEGRGCDIGGRLPAAGEAYFHDGEMGAFVAEAALFLGMPELAAFGDAEFYDLGFRALEVLQREAPGAREVMMTPHVPPGATVEHSFALQFQGMREAVEVGKIPGALERITVVALERVFVRECNRILDRECPGGVLSAGEAMEERSDGEL